MSRRNNSGPVLRSLSPAARFHSPRTTSFSSSSSFASSSAAFGARSSSTAILHRSSSPTRVNVYSNRSSSPSVRFTMDRSSSPNRSYSVMKKNHPMEKPQKRTCMCSPTSHPGSFRCSLHKAGGSSHSNNQTASFQSNSTRLNMRRSAMTNSLVRIPMEGDLVKRALASLIRPSSHQQRRRGGFQPRPSRLSVVSCES